MVYQYVAYNEKGEVVKGKLPAADEDAATDLLSYAGYRAISLKPYIPFLNLEKISASFFRVKQEEVILLYRQLAMLLESGIDIVASLELLQEQSTNRALKKVLGEVISDLRGGHQLSRALRRHPQAFSPVYCRLISVGEQSGDLESVLNQVADYMEKEITTTKETKSALMYPIITSVVTVGVIAVLVTFVLPNLGGLYNSLGIELPASAKLMIDLANQMQSKGVYLLIGLLSLIVAAYLYIRTPGGRYKWDRLLLRLPIFGRVIQLNELSRICRSMSLLFRAGLPLTEVMPLVIESSGNQALSQSLREVRQEMVRGEGISRPMAKDKLFLPMMVQMVRVGEETGNLDVTLLTVARSYEAEAQDKTRSLIALIQPVMTLVIGGIIALIAMSLVSAMYSLYGQGF
jgi:type IV pilus assembly protein PilC